MAAGVWSVSGTVCHATKSKLIDQHGRARIALSGGRLDDHIRA